MPFVISTRKGGSPPPPEPEVLAVGANYSSFYYNEDDMLAPWVDSVPPVTGGARVVVWAGDCWIGFSQTADGPVFRSYTGKTWEQIADNVAPYNETQSYQSIYCAAYDSGSGRIFVGCSGQEGISGVFAVYRSTNGGLNWTGQAVVNSSNAVPAMAADNDGNIVGQITTNVGAGQLCFFHIPTGSNTADFYFYEVWANGEGYADTLVYDGNAFYVAGYGTDGVSFQLGFLWTSTTGEDGTWTDITENIQTPSTLPPRRVHGCAGDGSGIFVISVEGNASYPTDDGRYYSTDDLSNIQHTGDYTYITYGGLQYLANPGIFNYEGNLIIPAEVGNAGYTYATGLLLVSTSSNPNT